MREAKVGDSDKILTVLSEDFGKISISARGVRKSGSKFGGARFSCYSRFTLFKSSRGYSINECELIKSFHNISSNIETLSLASYCAEIVCALSQEKVKEPKLLSLILNTFYVLDKNTIPLKQVKSVFELRAACIAGYRPDTRFCSVCGGENKLKLSDSKVICANCSSNDNESEISALKAVKYIIDAPDKAIFSFKCTDEVLDLIFTFSERYLLNYVEFVPKSLGLFKDLFT